MSMAAREISKTFTERRSGAGFGFSMANKSEIAGALRALADRIEQEKVVVQTASLEQLQELSEFQTFRWTLKFAEKFEPEATTAVVKYPCGCTAGPYSASDSNSIPDYCPEHGIKELRGTHPFPVAVAKKEETPL